jgi:curved DNA-binding protein
MNHYETLNVSPEASTDEIKKSYRKLAKQYHPDTNKGDDSKFKKLAEAYEILSDPKSRQIYDIKSRVNDSAQERFNRAWSSAFNQSDNFSDMFNNMYNDNAKGPDIRVALNITMEEVYYGTRRHINVGGDGFNLNIPKGILNGTKLKVKGRGAEHPMNSFAQRGDVIVTVNTLYDPEIIVNGSDIYVDLFLDWWDILLGGEFEVKTKINSIKIKVPQGTYDSKLLRVAGKGMPIYNTDEYGNLMVKIRTKQINLTEDQIEILKNIKEFNG